MTSDSKQNQQETEPLKVMHIHRYGICPICGCEMLLSSGHMLMSKVSEGGWIQQRLREKWMHTMICPRCGYKVDMEVRDCGLVPKGSESNLLPPILNERKMIGYVEENGPDSAE